MAHALSPRGDWLTCFVVFSGFYIKYEYTLLIISSRLQSICTIRKAAGATATPQALARAARSQSLALALAPCSTCSSGHQQISFDRAAQKEAEAIWGGARFCLGFGRQLYPSRVHRDLCFFEISETIWGVRAFCANTSHLSIGIFFLLDQRDRTQVQKKTTFFGSFFGAARVRISYVISSDGPFFATSKK